MKNSKSSDVAKTIAQEGGVDCLVAMATAEHAVMQNEALVALTLIAALSLGLLFLFSSKLVKF